MFTPAEIAAMPVAERVYFLQDHAAHVVARDDRRRLDRIEQETRRAYSAAQRNRYRI